MGVGFYCEMDVSFNGFEREAMAGEEGGRVEGFSLMESAIVQSFSRPNNSNGLFHTDTFCAASEAIMTVHSV